MTGLTDVDRFKMSIQDCVLLGFWPLILNILMDLVSMLKKVTSDKLSLLCVSLNLSC